MEVLRLELGDSWATWVRPTSRSSRNGIAASSPSKVRALARKGMLCRSAWCSVRADEGAGAPKPVGSIARVRRRAPRPRPSDAVVRPSPGAGFGQTPFEIAADILPLSLASPPGGPLAGIRSESSPTFSSARARTFRSAV